MTVPLWRIAADTPHYRADDTTGTGARLNGARWNSKGTAMLYSSPSISLSYLETVVHLPASGLPLNRYLVRIDVPDAVWDARIELAYGVGWDAEPPGQDSIDAGDRWVTANASALCTVQSVIVPEESNVLINPNHPDARKLTLTKLRKVLFDIRLGGRSSTTAPALTTRS